MEKSFLRLCVIAAFLGGALSSTCSSFGITLYANTFSSTLLNPSDFGAKTCIWKIRSQVAGYAVQISFNYLVVGSSSSCSSNYIAIHDGSSSSSVQLGKVCGSAKPPIIRSRGSYLYLKLVKTWSASFSITYKAVRLVSSTTQCSPSNSFYNNNNLRFSASSGTIRSPQYPLNYPSSMQCTWIITVPYGKKAELSFTSVSTEGGICSSNDYVQVRDGSSSDRSLGLFCSKPSTIRASGRTLWVRFRSDSDVFTGRGFEGRYTTQKSTSLASSSSSVGAGVIVGILFGVAGLIAFIVIIACCAKKGNRGGVVVRSTPATTTTVTTATNRVTVPMQPGYQPPPSQQVHYIPAQQPSGYPPPPPPGMQYPMATPAGAYPPPAAPAGAYPPPPAGAYPPPPMGPQGVQVPPGPAYPPPTAGATPSCPPPAYPGALQDKPPPGT